jgi:hypothetical protein
MYVITFRVLQKYIKHKGSITAYIKWTINNYNSRKETLNVGCFWNQKLRETIENRKISHKNYFILKRWKMEQKIKKKNMPIMKQLPKETKRQDWKKFVKALEGDLRKF